MSARLMHQHGTIRDLTAGLPVETLQRRILPDKWSVFENIAHLAAYQPVFITRLERISREPSPAFERYVAEQDPAFPSYLEKPFDTLLGNIDDQRIVILSRLKDGGEALLMKTGLHPRYGLLTGREWTEFFLLHEAHHLFTIFMLVQDLRKSCQ
jgi:DinB superfamily